MIDYSFSLFDLEYFLLILTRVTCFVFISPFFSMKNTPRHVRIGLSFFTAMLLYETMTPIEDMVTYNFDGKSIVARENEISAKRNEDMAKAYFNCHTDITIPYDEIGELAAVCETDSGITEEKPIIVAGRFMLKGCEELNKPLD